MAFLDWNDALLVGDRTMDDDHRRLVILINEVADCVVGAADAQTVCDAIGRLIDATEEHFLREEAMMRETGDPNAIVHARDHGVLITQIKILATLIGDGTLDVSIDLLRFFRGWLVNHIRTADRALTRHLAGVTDKGGSRAA
ncbi:MAG: bacteriohemerythrin [Rhodospirillales bacterium]